MNTGVSGVRQLLIDRGREPGIDRLIRLPVFRSEFRPDIDQVAERPQPFVRKSAVVGGKLVRRRATAAASWYAGVSGGTRTLSVGIDERAVGGAGAVRDPHAAALAHQRVERDRDAAGRRGTDDAAVAVVVVQVGLAVGHHDQRPRGARIDLAGMGQTGAEDRRARPARRWRSGRRAASAPDRPRSGTRSRAPTPAPA